MYFNYSYRFWQATENCGKLKLLYGSHKTSDVLYRWVFNTWFLGRPEIVVLGGLGGPGGPARPTKPYESTWFGAMDATKPYEFIGQIHRSWRRI